MGLQHEIKGSAPLLNAEGNLTESGFARKPLPQYDRARVKGGAGRLREWDSYLVVSDGFALALSLADDPCLGLLSLSLADFQRGWQTERHFTRPLPLGPMELPQSSKRGNAAASGRGYGVLFHNDGINRTLTAHIDGFYGRASLDAHVVLVEEPEESLVLCTPFAAPGSFCFQRIINGFRADGKITVGNRRYDFNLKDSLGMLHWGRGVWSGLRGWRVASAAGMLNGKPFGFFVSSPENDSASTEHGIFYDGKMYRLPLVGWSAPAEGEKPFTSFCLIGGGGRFKMKFVPLRHSNAHSVAGSVWRNRRRVFGAFVGVIVLENGTRLEADGLMGTVEWVREGW